MYEIPDDVDDDNFWAGSEDFKLKEFKIYGNVKYINSPIKELVPFRGKINYLLKKKRLMIGGATLSIVSDWLGVQNDLELKPLYVAKKDGDSFITILNKIKGKKKLLFLLRSHNYLTFGSYTHEAIVLNKYITDNKSFAFQLDYKVKAKAVIG